MLYVSRLFPALSLVTIAIPLSALQSASPTSVLGQVLAGLGGTQVTSTTLSGSADYSAGAANEAGGFSATCSIDGSSQLQLQIPSLFRTESRQVTNETPEGSWTDSAGTIHAIAGQNLMSPAAWFCPHIVIATSLQNQNLDIKYLGQQTKNGQLADHFSLSAHPTDGSKIQLWVANLSKMDLYLDSETLRPVALGFITHPDNDATVNIPVEILFKHYTETSGVWLPTTIEKYVNAVLMLSLQVQSSSLSSEVVTPN